MWKEDTSIEVYTAEVRAKKWKLQLEQLQNPISSTYRYFLQCLVTLGRTDRKYFLQCLKLGLNRRSVQLLEPLYERYNTCRLKDESSDKDKQLQEIDEQLTHGSLGLEHFFREMAVMYDNMVALGEHDGSCELNDLKHKLSEVVADIFLDGIAIEIMDGDAVTVPVSWIKAVIDNIQRNKSGRIYKVSVLGAQSCGKSTLLNTIFGLNFPVSSGRCTRGAYMQLVKVDDDLRKEIQCDYVLVIDSEGLMSRSKADTTNYDNELSTFIIGLSDLTLVIIKGEGNEMQDVLPLAIHVFLRMHIVGEYQACHFVHQNMGAVDAMQKVATEIDAFVRDLNLKTLAAATDAGQSEYYRKFTDVLHYDPAKDNTYVPGLWNGTPPMGSTNTHYAATMQRLKSSIMKNVLEMQHNSWKYLTTLEDFGKRLVELWDAIKYENFIFSFKNVLAYEAHKKLTNVFMQYQFILKSEIRTMIQKEETSMENGVSKGVSGTEITTMVLHSKQKIADKISKRGDRMKKNIMHYFKCLSGCKECRKDVRNRHLLSQYEREFLADISILKKSLTDELFSAMDALQTKLNANKELQRMHREMDGLLKQKVQSVIQKEKSAHLTKEDMERIFNEWWKEEAGEILREVRNTTKSVNIEVTVQAIIKKTIGTDSHVYLRTKSREEGKEKVSGEKGKKDQKKGKVRDDTVEFVVRKNHISVRKQKRGSSITEDDVGEEAGENEPKGDGGKKQKNKKGLLQKFTRTQSIHDGKEGSGKEDATIGEEITSFIKKRLKGNVMTEEEQLQEISDKMIAQTKKFYDPTFKSASRGFSERDAHNLFDEVWKQIGKIADEEKFECTDEYKGELMVYIEELAVAGFKKRHETYLKENSPKALLENKKRSYHDFFMAEMGQGDAAAQFSETVLKSMVSKNLEEKVSCNELFEDLRKRSYESFLNVKLLQASVMLDLYEKNDFDLYFEYITRYEEFMMNVIKEKSIEHFERDNQLKELAKRLLLQIIQEIIEAVDKAVDNPSDDMYFIKTMFSNIEGLKIPRDDAAAFEELTVPDRKQFAGFIRRHLSNQVKNEIMDQVKDWNVPEKLEGRDFYNFVFTEIVTCREKCPFCGVPCDAHSGGKKSGNHSATLHRPRGLTGSKKKFTQRLVVRSCKESIASKEKFATRETKKKYKPFKKYKKYYPDWTIHAEAKPDVEKYWKWVLAKYNVELAETYNTSLAKIPKSWGKFDREEIIADVKENYELKDDSDSEIDIDIDIAL